jgi:hypothetical protein
MTVVGYQPVRVSRRVGGVVDQGRGSMSFNRRVLYMERLPLTEFRPRDKSILIRRVSDHLVSATSAM